MTELHTGRNSSFSFLLLLIPGCLYLLFPTQNANIDSWYYAACVKHHKELIHSHHLLYNGIGLGWFQFLRVFNPDIEAIAALNIMNATAATFCLFIFYKILLLLRTEVRQALWLTLFCASSFGFMRFATDAETYILPLLFSLLSTWFFIRNRQLDLLWSGCFATLAILTHQLHLWWALAMALHLLFRKPFKSKQFLNFALPFILVPVVYYLSFLQTDSFHGNFFQFVNGEYSKGNADLNFSAKSLLLTVVNFIRSFIQIHGQIIDLVREYAVQYMIAGGIILGILIFSLKRSGLRFRIHKKTVTNPCKHLFLLAFIFHLVFAFLSSGNAEFMVMLPFLLILYIACILQIDNLSFLQPITLILFIWNLSTAILPSNICNLNRVDRQVEFTLQHPNDYFVWEHKPLVENIITYQNGFEHTAKYIRLNSENLSIIDSLVDNHIAVYTDFCNPGTQFSRESYLRDNGYLIGRFNLSNKLEWKNIYGKNHIYLIAKKKIK